MRVALLYKISMESSLALRPLPSSMRRIFTAASSRARRKRRSNTKTGVFNVVQPQITKTGGYIPVTKEDDEKTILCRAIQILKRTVDEKDALLEKQEPKVQFANAITASDGEEC